MINQLKKGKKKIQKPLQQSPNKISDDFDEHVVESILDKKEMENKIYYQVKWKGYAVKQASWVERSELMCYDLIKEFEREGTTKMSGDLRFSLKPISVFQTQELPWIKYRETWNSRIPTGNCDPVLTDVIFNWFCPKYGIILDPFPVECTPGIVAATLGLKYIGICDDIHLIQSCRQAVQNFKIESPIAPTFAEIESTEAQKYLKEPVDLIFSIPPLQSLLKSAKTYKNLLSVYTQIINNSLSKLNNNRFSCFVLEDLLDSSTGFYFNIIGDTISTFEANGAKLINSVAIVRDPQTSNCNEFENSRKLISSHQMLFCFYKGELGSVAPNFGKFGGGRNC